MEQAHEPASQHKRMLAIGVAIAWILAIALLFALYFHLCDMQMVGFLHDDGIYALTAKALASGAGYKLLNLPIPNSPDFVWQVKYPIAYPLLLSLGWLIQPNFPQNLPWLHGLTIGCAALAIPLLYRYLRQAKQLGRGLSGIICLLVATNFQYLYYATALMSEAPYLLLSLLTLWLADTGPANISLKRLIAMILAAALTFHTRTIGLTLIAAIILGLVLRKQWKNVLIFAISSVCLTIIPWGLWVKGHSLPLTSLDYPIAYIYGGYGIEYGINSPHGLIDFLQALLTKGLLPLFNNLVYLMFPQVSFWLGPYPWANDLFSLGLVVLLTLAAARAIKHRRFSISGLYVGFYLLAVILWMYPNQAIRFLLVILPWLWLATFQAASSLFRRLKPKTQLKCPTPSLILQRIGLALLAIFLLWPAWPGYQVLSRMRNEHLVELSGRTQSLWQDYQATFQFFRQHTNESERIASIWDPMVYLYTGHPTFGLFTSVLQPINGQATPESFRRLRASLIHYGVSYIVVEPFIINQEYRLPENPVATILLQQFPNEISPVYQAPHHLLSVYRFIPTQQ